MLAITAPPAPPAPIVAADTLTRDSTLRQLEQLAIAVADTFVARGVREPAGLFIMAMGEGGAGAQLNVMGGNVPEALRGSVTPLARDFINRRGTATPLTVTIRLERVDRGSGVSTIDEAPELRNRGTVSDYMGRIIAAYPAMARGWHEAVVDMRVNREGRVSIVHVRQWSGQEDINAYLTGLADQLRFTPARTAGRPVPAWVRQTFTFGIRP